MSASPASSQIVLIRNGARLATHARVAVTWPSRLVGLLDRARLAQGEGLVLPHCRSIHTCGMRCAIDVIFMDRAWRVVALKLAVPPWRIVGPMWRAWGVVEVAAGTIQHAGVQCGDQLRLV